jgi:hypothetical protein
MLNIKLGRSIDWNFGKPGCPEEVDANKLLKREYRVGYEYPV